MPFVIVGNCCDELHKRVVSYEEGESFAREFQMPFFECSAITGYNVDAMFSEAASVALISLGTDSSFQVLKGFVENGDLNSLQNHVKKLTNPEFIKYCDEVKHLALAQIQLIHYSVERLFIVDVCSGT